MRPTIFLVAALLASGPALADEPRVCFTPGDDCTNLIVETIATSRSTILVQAYSFTSAPIAQALVEAKRRGVDVRAILDKSNLTGKYSGADFLANGAVQVLIDDRHAIAHNKIMVIDGATVLTGSFNFTKAAQASNAENLLVIRDPKLAASYAANWRRHFDHSIAYASRAK